ncbi:MAG: hypothetical protein CMD65_03565 [Gammaproteobacteria bacterium]|nr:hypothetical protein [Gammaproteobacteria bacterium]|tara:strand:- start:504 stop:1556 length:1053 start_codon:yes stop_codon:yes gene_type:complete
MTKIISKKYLNRKFWKNKTILLTGINGFIGGNLAKILIEYDAKVIGLTNTNKKNKFLEYEKIYSKLKIYNVDIKNYSKIDNILKKHTIDICFHLAAQVDVNVANNNPFQTFETNIRGTYNLLEILRHHKSIKSIIVASSDKAYGDYNIKDLPYTENHDLRPSFPYDVSKASADMIAKSYSTNIFNLPIIITRFANIYGPGQLNFTALIPDVILNILGYRNFIPRSNGLHTRDFLYVDDVSYLYMCLAYNLFKDKRLSGEVFNAGTDKAYKIKDIIFKICKISNNSALINKIKKDFLNKKPSGEILHQSMSYKKLNNYFDWKPTFSMDDGIFTTIKWYKAFLKKYNYKNFL